MVDSCLFMASSSPSKCIFLSLQDKSLIWPLRVSSILKRLKKGIESFKLQPSYSFRNTMSLQHGSYTVQKVFFSLWKFQTSFECCKVPFRASDCACFSKKSELKTIYFDLKDLFDSEGSGRLQIPDPNLSTSLPKL